MFLLDLTGELVWEFQVQLRRFRLHIENAVTRNKRRTRNQVASEWVKKIFIRSWVELHFTAISYILSFNYSYRYEINLIRIMYTANSSILYSKEKTVRILGTWHQYLLNVSGLRYFQTNRISRRINKLSENLTSLSIFALNIKPCLWNITYSLPFSEQH